MQVLRALLHQVFEPSVTSGQGHDSLQQRLHGCRSKIKIPTVSYSTRGYAKVHCTDVNVMRMVTTYVGASQVPTKNGKRAFSTLNLLHTRMMDPLHVYVTKADDYRYSNKVGLSSTRLALVTLPH